MTTTAKFQGIVLLPFVATGLGIRALVIALLTFGFFFAKFAFYMVRGLLVGFMYGLRDAGPVRLQPFWWTAMCVVTGTYERKHSRRAGKKNAMKNRVQTLVKPELRHQRMSGIGARAYNLHQDDQALKGALNPAFIKPQVKRQDYEPLPAPKVASQTAIPPQSFPEWSTK